MAYMILGQAVTRDTRIILESSVVLVLLYLVTIFLVRFGSEGWVIGMNNLEDLIGAHICSGVALHGEVSHVQVRDGSTL